MSVAKPLQRSFAGGEIAPEMFGRIDLTKFQTGLRLARNFRTLAHGPATRRTGFRYVNEVADSTKRARLIPFAYSADDAVIIELGHQTARFHTASGTILEAGKSITGVTTAATAVFTVASHGYSTGDGVYVSGIASGPTDLNGQFYEVVAIGANTFSLRYLDGTAVSTASMSAYGLGGTVARVYTLATPWTEAMLPSLVYSQDAEVLAVSSQSAATQELRRVSAANWTIGAASFTPTLAPPTGVGAVATIPTSTNPIDQSYVVTSIGADGITESVASSVVTATNNLTIFGNFNTVSWTAEPDATRYYVYKLRGGSYGYIGQTTTTSFVDDNILPDTTQTPPQNFTSLNAASGEYPAAVTHFEQRRWFGGTGNGPQSVWGTRSGTDTNLTSSVPSRDDDALSFRIKAKQQNAVRHLVPLIDLVVLTAGGIFRVFADPGPVITPGSLSIKPQGYAGASAVQPALTSDTALYVQARGSRVRELLYDPNGLGRYRSTDVSLFAPHLFDGYTISELAYTEAPDQVLWAVRSDGTLLGLTYVPEQQVYGWHQHVTDGVVEACASIPEDGEDTLYVIVRRTINGRTCRYVERMESRFFDVQADAFYVDCGLTYTGAATTVIKGLRHLEGETVAVLSNGAIEARKVVTDGSITLDEECTAGAPVHIGLPYVSDLQTLPAQFEAAAAGQGTMKNVSKVHLRVTDSALVKAGPSFDKLVPYPARQVADNWGLPPSLRTAELRLAVSPSWDTDGSVCVRQDEPVPLTVLSLALELSVGG